jgi:ABC-type multidrug transport system fused ATPase/permease subunit
LSLLGVLITLSIVSLSIISLIYNILPISANIIGLSLLVSLNTINNLSGFISSSIEFEQLMIHVERILHYISNLKNEYSRDNDFNSDKKSVYNCINYIFCCKNYKKSNKNEYSIFIPTNNNNNESSNINPAVPLLNNDDDNNNNFEINDGSIQSDVVIQHNNYDDDNPLLEYDNWPNDGTIQFNNISLNYNDPINKNYTNITNNYISDLNLNTNSINNMSITIPGGSKVAIIGRSGSGKSSIFGLLTGLYSQTNNESSAGILYDNVEISAIPKKILRQSGVFTFPQDPFILIWLNVLIFSDIGTPHCKKGDRKVREDPKRVCSNDVGVMRFEIAFHSFE